ncbi:hypothetical protein [Ekhidna sp.]|uniref:hypothetical protein n=1 Tax=Ekhidna sp. TaxID=2608089 RepID=UPI0035123F65
MRKNILLFYVFLVFNTSLVSQTKAYTEYGDTIFVYDNGTWSFEELDSAPSIDEFNFLKRELSIDTISTLIVTSPESKKEVRNAGDQFTLKYNEKVWSRIPPANLNEEAEFAFQAKNFDAWCVVISEETKIPMDNLYRIAINQLEENLNGSVEILKVELRNINGSQVLRGVSKTEFGGIPIIFDSYYFSNEKGSVQVVTYASDVLWEKNKDKIHDLLNGFMVKK